MPPDATKFCMLGGLWKLSRNRYTRRKAEFYICRTLPDADPHTVFDSTYPRILDIGGFNDYTAHDKRDIVRKLRKAAKLAQKAGE